MSKIMYLHLIPPDKINYYEAKEMVMAYREQNNRYPRKIVLDAKHVFRLPIYVDVKIGSAYVTESTCRDNVLDGRLSIMVGAAQIPLVVRRKYLLG